MNKTHISGSLPPSLQPNAIERVSMGTPEPMEPLSNNSAPVEKDQGLLVEEPVGVESTSVQALMSMEGSELRDESMLGGQLPPVDGSVRMEESAEPLIDPVTAREPRYVL